MRIDGSSTIQSAELAQWLEVFMASSTQRIRQIETQKDQLEVRSAVFNDLRSKLSGLLKLVKEFNRSGSLSVFGARTAVASRDGVLTATATASATSHAHSIHVSQLARAHAVISHSYASTGTDVAAVYAGTVSFTVGVGGVDHRVDVAIDPEASNAEVLRAVASAIDTATAGAVRGAAIADTDTTTRLSITSNATGTANQMTFADTSGLLGALGVTNAAVATDTTGGYIHADLGNHELDARLTVDGISIIRGSNTIQDAIPGVTLNLLATQADTDLDLSLVVAVDHEAIRSKIDELLTTYNEAYAYLESKVRIDRDTFARGDLAGNYAFTSLWQQLRTGVAGAVSTSGDPALFALSQIGITAGSTGSLSVTNASKLEDMLKSDLATVEALFNSEDGIAGRLTTLIERYTKSDGVIANSAESIRSQRRFLDGKIQRLEALQEMERERLIEQYGALQEASKLQESMLTMLSVLTQSLYS